MFLSVLKYLFESFGALLSVSKCLRAIWKLQNVLKLFWGAFGAVEAF